MKISVTSVCLAGLLACGSAWSAATLQVLSATSVVEVGETFVVRVRVSGLGEAMTPSIGVYDIDLLYDSAQTSFYDMHFGSGLDPLGLGSLPEAKETVPGTLNLFELSLDSADDLNVTQPGTFDLASVYFSAMKSGVASFSLSINAIGDADGESLSLDVLPPLSIAITAVPEPQTVALLLGGLGLVGVAARRRSANQFWH